MSPPLRDTKYAREIASARLPSGDSGKSFVAIERIFVKQAEQIEIRFSWWEGKRMIPRPLDLPEEELLPLLQAAVGAGVFSREFLDGLRRALGETGAAAPVDDKNLTDLDRVQAHFHHLIRARAGDRLRAEAGALPTLARDAAGKGLRLMAESWPRAASGSGQLHEITPAGARLLGEGFV